jgi:hypothetical protein
MLPSACWGILPASQSSTLDLALDCTISSVRIVVFLIVTAALTAAPGSGVPNGTTSRFCVRFDQKPAVVRAACKQIPALRDQRVTNVEATNLLRRWGATWIDLSASSDTLLPPGWDHNNIDALNRLLRADAGGVYCAGTAWTMVKLYRAFGFEAWVYSYGMLDTPATHAVTLVRIGKTIVVQDAYLNYALTDTRGRPLDVRQALRLLRDRQPQLVRRDEPKLAAPRDILYGPKAYAASLKGAGWLGNNWPDSRRNMRACGPHPRGFKCSVAAVDYMRMLRFFWSSVLNAYPRLVTRLPGLTSSEKLKYLMAEPIGLSSVVDGWVTVGDAGTTRTSVLLREIVAAARRR